MGSSSDAGRESLPQLEAIELVDIHVPRSEAGRIKSVYGRLSHAHHVLVMIHAEGLVGLGEAPVDPTWDGEDATSVRNAIERHLAPAILGRSWGIHTAVKAMNRALAGNWCAKAAIETALWDIVGKVAGLPLHVLLGGGPPLPLPVKYVIGMVEPSEVHEEVSHGRELGFRYFKLKVGGELGSDLERVEAVTEVLNEPEQVGVDANGGWSHATALQALEPMQALGVAFLEQPVSPRYLDAMVNLTARSGIPVVAHESLTPMWRAPSQAEALAHVWALTPSNSGGIAPTLELLFQARADGTPCLLGSAAELGIGTALLVQVGAAFEEIACGPIPSDLAGPLWNRGDIVSEPLRLEGGLAYAPTGSGLGVELDHERIAAYRVEPS